MRGGSSILQKIMSEHVKRKGAEGAKVKWIHTGLLLLLLLQLLMMMMMMMAGAWVMSHTRLLQQLLPQLMMSLMACAWVSGHPPSSSHCRSSGLLATLNP